jgi:hypothetical protein
MSTSHVPGAATEPDGGDELDDLLSSSAPALSPVSESDVAPLVVQARLEARRELRPSHGRRAAITGLVILISVGAAGAAAAAWTGFRAPWAAEPTGTYSYTLPSGEVCKEHVGPPDGLEPKLQAALREWFAHHDVMAEADIQGQIQQMRSDPSAVRVLDDGSMVDASYGTPYYPSPDDEYFTAVGNAVQALANAELKRLGREEPLHTWSVETHCSGAK